MKGFGIFCLLIFAFVVVSVGFPFFLQPGSIDRGSAIYNYGLFVGSNIMGYLAAGIITFILGYLLAIKR